jgi:hypothetical protein
LKAALPHVPINLGAAALGARADDIDGRFLAAFQRSDHFIDHTIVD